MPAKTTGAISLKPGSGSAAGNLCESDGVADFDIGRILDIGDEVADFAWAEDFDRLLARGMKIPLRSLQMSLPVAMKRIERFFCDLAADDADIDHNAAIRVVMGIKDKCA